MKRFLLFLLLAHVYMGSNACTNLIVGKKASTDGSVICAYCCDCAGYCSGLIYTPAGKHAKGEQIPVRNWRTDALRGYVDQVENTYNVLGYCMNDHQLSILETTFQGREELQNKDGILQYRNMMNIALQRCTTAREAIKVMTDLVQKYGYGSYGESITVCDKNEAWILEMIGKGPDVKGAVWVAVRIPDDCISGHSNVSRIRQFPLHDKDNCMYAKDVISFARSKGYFTGKDEDFSFRDAYCPISFDNVRWGDARMWSFFRHHYNKAEMDKYLPYLNGEFDKCDALPLYIKPDKLVSVEDIKEDMRDHYEGTPLDMTNDVMAGPWGSPARPNVKVQEGTDGKKYFNERPIATSRTEFCVVCHIRPWLPDDIGGVMYYTNDDASMTAYVPIYCGVNRIPDAFKRDLLDYSYFNDSTAFWLCNYVSNMVYPRYSAMIPDVEDAQKELEDYYAEDQKTVEAEVAKLTTTDRTDYLTRKTQEYTDRMMNRWHKLARLLITKHNDMNLQPSENGEVIRTHKRNMVKGQNPTFAPVFMDAVGKVAGEKHLVK